MESDIFRAGVAPGAPSTQVEIKMLLCYILSNAEAPMDFSQLYEALCEHNLVNYFELVRVLDELCSLGQLESSAADGGPEVYRVTELGSKTSREFERNIPFSVREKALNAARRVLRRQRRLTEVKINETRCEGGGIQLELSIPDIGGELISLKVFAPTDEQRDIIVRRFLNCPLTVYKGVMALLTGDEKVLGDIFSRDQNLF